MVFNGDQDWATVAGWERGENPPVGSYRKLLEDFITGDGLLPARPVTASVKSRFSARKITAGEARLTKAALARQIGVNVNTLWRWERGDRKPHGLHRKLIADLMRDSV